jgi:putative iron-dependent peroxidase
VRSDRADVNHIVAGKVCNLLADSVELIEQIRGFRFLDGRDLTGFVDGTENPQGRHRRTVALVNDSEDHAFAGGSYLHIQRYRHNLSLWNTLKVKEQEDIFARTKIDNEEYSTENKLPTSHIKRSSITDSEGNPLEIVRQSMPYGDMKVQGLFFVAYCQSPTPFENMLKSMISGDGHGNFDHLLKYTQAETGAAFFAPSLNVLTDLVNAQASSESLS